MPTGGSTQNLTAAEEGKQGLWYAAGRGPLSVPNNRYLNFLLVNPAESQKLVHIYRYRSWASTAAGDIEIRVNPTTSLPTTVVTPANRRVGFPPGAAIITCDVATTVMGGGTVLPYKIPIAEGDSVGFTDFIIEPFITVPPGFSIGSSHFSNTGNSNMTALLDYKITDYF